MTFTVPIPDISVCIANYNGARYVLECIASVYAQQGDFRIEILLHDDCSNDNSLELIRQHFPDVIVTVSAENVGYCISNNRMVSAANGRYVLLLNNDAVLRRDSLSCLLHYADDGNEDCILGLPQYSLVDAAVVDHGYRTDPFFNPIPIEVSGTHEAGVATAACMWVPRKIWDEIGGFPVWFESVAEDIFLCVAARLLGYRVIVLEGPGFDHWIGKNFGGGKVVAQRLSTTARRRALSERNKTFVMLLCYPAPLLAILLPLHALALLIESLFLLANGTDTGKIMSIYPPIPLAVVKQRKSILQLRAKLMRRRQSNFRNFIAYTNWLPYKFQMLLRYGSPELR